MPLEDRGKGARLVVLKKRVHVVNYYGVNYGVDKSTYLTNQESLQHTWDITFQHPGQLRYHTTTVYKHTPSMLLTQVHCSCTPTFYPRSKLPDLHDHLFTGYLFLFLIDAHGKMPLLRFYQVPLDPGKQGQHGPDIDKCGLDVLSGHKVPQHKVNNVTSVLKSSKPYFAWYIQQSVAANTTFSVTRSLCCMHRVYHCHSNLVTTPSLLSSFCRILFILGKLKIELTKNPLHHAGEIGEHSCGENLYNGDKNRECSCGENFHGNNIKRHIKSHHTWQSFKHPCSLDDN